MNRSVKPVGANRFELLYQWARDELELGNRSKASRINKVAERLRPNGYRFLPRPPRPPKCGSGVPSV